jgi:catechol 2,3-dioxygenase-like lactoylglutathione lyase family enzyme
MEECMLKQVAYVTLFVKDQDKALDFYINTLGFEKREENPGGRVKFVTVGLKGQDLQVVLWPGTPGKADPTAGPIPGACIIETSDLDGEFERLKGLGVELVEKEPIVYPSGAGYANFTDPDGNRLSLRGPAKPRQR